jgi:hypothetical protein
MSTGTVSRDEAFKALRAKYIAPIEGAARRMFRSEDGAKVLSALERAFVPDSIPKDHNGAVDPNAVLINEGARQVIDYLRQLAGTKEEGQE